MKKVLLTLALLLCTAFTGYSALMLLQSGDVTTLEWDYTAENEAQLGIDGGFNFYATDAPSVTTGVFGNIINSTTPDRRQIVVDSSQFCGTKFYTMTAFMPITETSSQLESDHSNEVFSNYAPKPVDGLSFADPGTFTWNLSTSENICTDLHYNVYLSKQKGSYSAADIIGTVGKGVNTLSVDVSGYHGMWYTVVIPATTAYNGNEIPGDVSNELSLGFRPNKPTNVRVVNN